MTQIKNWARAVWKSRWKWPLLLLLVVGLVAATWRPAGTSDQPASPDAVLGPAAAPPVVPHPHDRTPADRQSARDDVLTGFATDFTTIGAGKIDWHNRVSRWTSDYLDRQLATTAAYRIPQATGPHVDVASSGPTLVDATITYDSGLTLAVRLEQSPGQGWQVTAAEPAD